MLNVDGVEVVHPACATEAGELEGVLAAPMAISVSNSAAFFRHLGTLRMTGSR